MQQLVVRAGRRISAWLQPGNRRYFPVFLFGLSVASSSLVALLIHQAERWTAKYGGRLRRREVSMAAAVVAAAGRACAYGVVRAAWRGAGAGRGVFAPMGG